MAGSKTVSLRNARQRSIHIAATVFLLPALIFLAVYVAYPIIESFRTSTMRWSGMGGRPSFIGLTNWIELVKDVNFWQAFVNNLKIMFLSLLFQVPFAMALATFLDVTEKKGSVFKVVWFIPYLLSSVAIGVLFKYSLDANYGIIASVSKLFGGGAIDLLGNPTIALYTVIGVVCWQYIPFYMVLYLAAYGTIPVELYEAASIDGATRGQYFWRVSLPLLRPTVVSGMTLSIIGSLKYFDLVYVMTGGGPGVATELMATYMYKNSFVRFNMGYGSTVAAGMFILITLVALITIATLNRRTEL
ncbi:MAG: sugar ABC transporter permease [Treponema sp.]|nr:sugar ABC transporter permease [Treponema sp.]